MNILENEEFMLNNEEVQDIQEPEEEEIVDKPIYALVQISEIEKLLQRCPDCGMLPGGKSTGQPRNIKWLKNGTSLTAIFNCNCDKNKKNHRKRWSSQAFIQGTQTRSGNLSIIAASQVAAISFAKLDSMFKAASIPLMSKRSFLSLSQMYIWPTIEDAYYRQQSNIYRSIPNPANIAIDGNFDSPGFSAELCAVAALEETTHQVIDFSIVHKSEVGNHSNQMELQGVKNLLQSVESQVGVGGITIDKHPQIALYLRNNNYDYGFDPWHRLKGIKKELKKLVRSMKDEEEKNQMKSLARRFIVHVYTAIKKSNGDVRLCKEIVFSFFLHVIGIHNWPLRKFSELIAVAPNTKVCQRFQDEKFSLILQCPHVANPAFSDSRHEYVRPDSNSYQLLLSLVAKTTFMNDLDKMRHGNNTSFVENFWSICIRYRPKMLYFPKIGFSRRTMLAAMDFNEMRQAELSGDRKISEVYECYSKGKGEKVTKVKKTPIKETWKRSIVEEVLERKRIQGPGDPEDVDQEYSDEEDSDEELDFIQDRLDNLLYFSDSEEEYVED